MLQAMSVTVARREYRAKHGGENVANYELSEDDIIPVKRSQRPEKDTQTVGSYKVGGSKHETHSAHEETTN